MEYIIAIFLSSFPANLTTPNTNKEVSVCKPQAPNNQKNIFSSENITIDGLSYIKAPTQWKKNFKNF